GWKLNNDSTRDLVISGLDPDDITYKEGEVPIVTNEETPISDAPHRFSVNILDNPDQTEGTETEFILTNGQKGTKILTEFEDLVNGAGLIKSATYQFEKVGKFYVVNYSRLPGDPDNTTMVEKVIKTLQF
ncbi:MAG TPA: hypothetical protein VFX86_02010, partial [Candidatus Saccharimonadales bacterium]|nr:hypothetical protein [Candidatus Saccharimonadales bacterium]